MANDIYGLIGSRWVPVVLRTLQDDCLRYNELHRRARGISHKMLTHTLRQLEAVGFIGRRDEHTQPPCVVYWLTQSGIELTATLALLEHWAQSKGIGE